MPLGELSKTTSPTVRPFRSHDLSCCCNAYIHALDDVGEWPNTLATKRISRIVIYSGDVIDSLRITYELTSGAAKIMQHGGDGGGMFLDLPVAGNLYFV